MIEDERTAVFECEINKPNMAAHWSKNGNPLQPSDKYQMTVDGTKHRLEIKNSQKFDDGTFEIIIDGESTAASLTVETVDIELVKPLEDITSEETPYSLTFACEFSKGDLPASWTRNGKPLEIAKRLSTTTAGNTYQLHIKNATPEDEGEYAVTVKGVTTTAKLMFLITPGLKLAKKYESVIVIKAGQSTAFEVPFVGYPKPSVEWHFNGKELPKVKRLEVETTPDVTSLKVKQSERNDRGTYTCNVSNKVCTVSADITLDVLDKPGLPENLKVTDVGEETATLEWHVPSDNGGSDVTHYLVDKKEVGKRSYAQVAKVAGTSVTIDNLREGHSYLFQVTAVNDIGKGEPAEIENAVVPTSKFSKCYLLLHLVYTWTSYWF